MPSEPEELTYDAPVLGWVVHQVIPAQGDNRDVWAWCQVAMPDPGYAAIHFTLADGQTPADPGPGRLRLGPVITKVWC